MELVDQKHTPRSCSPSLELSLGLAPGQDSMSCVHQFNTHAHRAWLRIRS